MCIVFEGFRTGRKQHSVKMKINGGGGGKDKIRTELVICGNVVRHAVSFHEEEMACSEQESVKAEISSLDVEVNCGGEKLCISIQTQIWEISDRQRAADEG